jgi:hypothetical protein
MIGVHDKAEPGDTVLGRGDLRLRMCGQSEGCQMLNDVLFPAPQLRLLWLNRAISST